MKPFDNVRLEPKANIYNNGKCISHTFHTADGEKKTAGIMLPENYNFNTGAPEIMELLEGACRVKLAGEKDWKNYRGGEQFTVPGNSSFEIEVTEALQYICHFG